jgi:prefoldin subunit 5
MKESFLGQLKTDGQAFIKVMGFARTLGKLKLEIRSKRQSKERQLKDIGSQIYNIYHSEKTLDGTRVIETVGSDLQAVKELDEEISSLEGQIEEAKATLRNTAG